MVSRPTPKITKTLLKNAAKKNERVQQDLDLKLQQLSEARSEYEKLTTADVGLSILGLVRANILFLPGSSHRTPENARSAHDRR